MELRALVTASGLFWWWSFIVGAGYGAVETAGSSKEVRVSLEPDELNAIIEDAKSTPKKALALLLALQGNKIRTRPSSFAQCGPFLELGNLPDPIEKGFASVCLPRDASWKAMGSKLDFRVNFFCKGSPRVVQLENSNWSDKDSAIHKVIGSIPSGKIDYPVLEPGPIDTYFDGAVPKVPLLYVVKEEEPGDVRLLTVMAPCNVGTKIQNMVCIVQSETAGGARPVAAAPAAPAPPSRKKKSTARRTSAGAPMRPE